MKEPKAISASVISRLPRYYRFLCDLATEGTIRISSKELAHRLGVTASQIRQDFNCFGGFGQQGYGYNVEQLKKEMAAILDLQAEKSAILVGAGNLGRAIVCGMKFEDMGFQLSAVFDASPDIIGQTINGTVVLNADELTAFCTAHRPQMAILCLPEKQAPETVALLEEAGVNSFWNFSHYDILGDYPQAQVTNVHLGDSLMTLSYIIHQTENRGI
ncbi:MAG: redox-sensing transcriptional repressor Rex [Clostridia bacterium]|nr:redox-sensing transcriptional repressor Rex [Clostridia bacterium]